MAKLNNLSPEALSAAMRGGTAAWGRRASSTEHVRYIEPLPSRSRSRCYCGCGRRATHNGIALIGGCEMSMRRWVKDPRSYHMKGAGEMSNREKFWTLIGAAGLCLIVPAMVGDPLIGTVAAKILAMIAGGLYGAGTVGWWMAEKDSSEGMKVLGREG